MNGYKAISLFRHIEEHNIYYEWQVLVIFDMVLVIYLAMDCMDQGEYCS